MQVRGILETALYADDPAVTAAFYRRVFGLGTLLESDRLIALDAGGRSVLLLFRRGTTEEPVATEGGVIPGHSGGAPTHFAFSIATDEVGPWRERLAAEGVAIESEVDWPHGARSLYFRDPDGNLGELVSPGLWAIY